MIQQLVIGLPESCKSSFIGALWAVVRNPASGANLRAAELNEDRVYLNELADAWIQFEPVPRTASAEGKSVTLILSDVPTGKELKLTWSDRPGEVFEEHHQLRRVHPGYTAAAREAGGVLIFIRASKRTKHLLIHRPKVWANALGNPERPGGCAEPRAAQGVENSDGIKRLHEPFKPKLVPTQAQIVELVQFLSEPPLGPRPRRVSIMMSAWDEVEAVHPGATPGDVLASAFPLLHQFINAKGDPFLEFKIFGISPQGCAYDDPAKLKSLYDLPPEERIIVVDGEKRHHDLTVPVRWLAGLL